jgi:hypothetical protein
MRTELHTAGVAIEERRIDLVRQRAADEQLMALEDREDRVAQFQRGL